MNTLCEMEIRNYLKMKIRPVACADNPRTWGAEAGGLQEPDLSLGHIARPCLKIMENETSKCVILSVCVTKEKQKISACF